MTRHIYITFPLKKNLTKKFRSVNLIVAVCFVLLSPGCTTQTSNTNTINGQVQSKELQKEDAVTAVKLGTGTNFKFKGLAIDVENSEAYLGSWDKKEIVKVSLGSSKHEILKTEYSGKLNGMGCYIKNGFVFALMNEVDDNPNSRPISALLIFDMKSGKLIKTYEAKGIGGRNHFNHIVVDDKGVAYISNTLKSSIYTVDTNNPADSLKEFISHKDLSWVHGIDLSPDGTKLFTTSYDAGIKFLDLKTKKFSSYKDKALAGDDGLKYYNGYLYGVGQNKIKRYTLDEAQTKVIKTEIILENHEYFNDPRCLHIENGYLYCLANIEFQPVSFAGQNKSFRNTALNDTYLIKMKLKN